MGSRFPPRRLPRATACRHGISNPSCKRSSAAAFCDGIRGPRGGYELARDRRHVTANDILRAAGTVDEGDQAHAGSELLNKIVLPAMANAEHQFGVALARINLEDMARDAQALSKPGGRGVARS